MRPTAGAADGFSRFFDQPPSQTGICCVLSGTLLLAIALRHVFTDACLEERQRKPAPRLLIGIEAEADVPGPDNLSRFHAHVGAVLVVHLAFASLLAQTQRYQGSYGKRKLSPLAKALRKQLQTHESAAAEPLPG